jgi:predicted ATP-dependent endonuclease of OLD family
MRLKRLEIINFRSFEREVIEFDSYTALVGSNGAGKSSILCDQALPPLGATLARVNQALQPALNELFFTPRLVLVEGLEDVAYVTTWMILGGYWTEFRRRGCHIVPVGGKSEIIQPLAVAISLEIPTFVFFDADGADQNPHRRALHQADNLAILRLMGGDESEVFPEQVVWEKNYAIWPDTLDQVLKADVGSERWDQIYGQVNQQFGNPKGFGQNAMHIGAKLALLHDAGEVCTSLDRLCQTIVAHGNEKIPAHVD